MIENWNANLKAMNDVLCETFGKALTYTRKTTGEVFSISAIYDETYAQDPVYGTTDFTNPIKMLDIRLSDIGGAPKQGDRVVLDQETFIISDVITSTSGMMKVALVEDHA
ncbi:hypothetical protein [Bartonella sp. DGB2]|uniref:head-tail joining protein n=1 Tax=Bartonella sp. DGB2 TaxID=3388426 RepID=UPI00398FBD6D